MTFLRANYLSIPPLYEISYLLKSAKGNEAKTYRGRVHTLSRRGGRCFLRRRCRFRSLEAVLCSVALLNLQVQGSKKGKQLGEKHAAKSFIRFLSVSSSSTVVPGNF